MIEKIINFFSLYSTYFYWLGILSTIFFIISLFFIPYLALVIPKDYFKKSSAKHSNIMVLFIRNILGIVILLIGVLLLFMPGPGMLVILISFILMEFPYKKKIELWFIKKTKLLEIINKIRKNKNKPEIEL